MKPTFNQAKEMIKGHEKQKLEWLEKWGKKCTPGLKKQVEAELAEIRRILCDMMLIEHRADRRENELA